jgi:Mu transposase-like protein
MLVVETIAKIRRGYFVQGKAIKAISRELKVSRKVVRRVIRSGETAFVYERRVQPQPKLGPWREELERLLAANAARANRERLTLVRWFEELRALGYCGGYDAVRRYAARWRRQQSAPTSAFVPLSFAPGEAYQFDWSHEVRDRTIWEMFEAERASLVPYAGPFDGFHAVPATVSKTCLVRFDNNKYSVAAGAVGRPVEIRAYADRIELRQDGRVVGEHRRVFGRGQTVYDPWHYVPVLARKPGALRNGAPFKAWLLPAALERVRRKLARTPGGDRQMVAILSAVLTDGLAAVEAACAEALAAGVHSADVVLNILARRRELGPPLTITTPDALRLCCEPAADCARYDRLRRAI